MNPVRPERMSTAAHARLYRSLGWSVIPVRPGGKRPLVPWQGFQQHPAAPATVDHWFAQGPEANLGVVTGAVSGLIVLDIDPEHGGMDSMETLVGPGGEWPVTATVQTGGGGWHLYFAHPGGSIPNRVGLWPGIDVRGDGGFVVAPPSVHPSGGRYRWHTGRDPRQVGLAAMPAWLHETVISGREGRGHGADYWRDLARAGVTEGRRNDTIASFTGHLLWHGVDPAVVMELMLGWNRCRCHPPLDDEEVARTVQSILQTHRRHGDE